MAAAPWPGAAAASASPHSSLLLSRSRPHGLSPASYMPRRLILGVGTSAVAALAVATAPPAVLQDGAATLFATAGAYALVRTFDVLTERRLVEKVSSLTNISQYFLLSATKF